MIRAELKNYRQSPRKVRFVADAIRGKKIKDAKDILAVISKRSALPLKKLLDSAIANAKHNFNIDTEDLYIKELRVDSGITMHRMMPRARGSAFAIKKKTSHVLLVLDKKINPLKKTNSVTNVSDDVKKVEKKDDLKKVKETKKVSKKKVSKNKK